MNEIPGWQDERPAVLLDVSLFILDLLGPAKIAEKAASEYPPLEVPGAFVTMIRAARAGNRLLYDFLYAYLVGIKRNRVHIESSDETIRTVVTATEEELRKKAELAADRILHVFAPLIEGGTEGPFEPPEEFFVRRESPTVEEAWYPIRRYEPVVSVTKVKLLGLRRAYTKELDLPVHPLFDMYFLQVYHAERIGLGASPAVKRQLVSVGRSTFGALAGWMRRTRLPSTTTFDLQRYRDILDWFVQEYVRDEWRGAAISLLVEMTISYITTLHPGVVLALTGLGGATVLHVAWVAPGFTTLESVLISVLVLAAVAFIPILYTRPSWLFGRQGEMVCPLSPTAILEPTTSSEPSEEVIPAGEAPIPESVAQSSDFEFCLYVVQPGDSLHAIASRFQVSEESLRANNKLLNLGVFRVHQMLLVVDAPCCRPIGDQGISHFVQRGETLYSIARRYGTTVEKLAWVNHLYEPSYIQAGQMLCIPSEEIR